MSRSYRISVRESCSKVIKAEDKVSTKLEILEVLPPEAMAAMLAAELGQHGFEENDEGEMVRVEDGVVIAVDTCSGTVSVSVEASEATKVEGELSGRAYDDVGPHAGQVRENLKHELQKNLEKKIEEKTTALQGKVTDQLEGKLGELQAELDQVVNTVTANALKAKAAQMGQIKEITEDAQSGSMTIVVEV
jgi:hypothetical protein